MPRLIDADALMNDFCDMCGTAHRCKRSCGKYDLIAHAPTIDAEPVRHGRYGFVGPHIGSTCSPYAEHGTCIECKERILIDPYHKNYCPNCGAKMDLEVQDGT